MEMERPEINSKIISVLTPFNVEGVGIFGSFVRDDFRKSSSDIDIMVKFKKTLTLIQLIKIENLLSEQLGIKVDLITSDSINNNRFIQNIEKNIEYIM